MAEGILYAIRQEGIGIEQTSIRAHFGTSGFRQSFFRERFDQDPQIMVVYAQQSLEEVSRTDSVRSLAALFVIGQSESILQIRVQQAPNQMKQVLGIFWHFLCQLMP